jgi:hypothetical protein
VEERRKRNKEGKSKKEKEAGSRESTTKYPIVQYNSNIVRERQLNQKHHSPHFGSRLLLH